MGSSNYWNDGRAGRRIGRRRFVGGAVAASAGAAAFAAVGCGDDDDDGGASSNTPAGTATAAGSATATATAVQAKQGGTTRLVSANATYDSFDLNRSRVTPVGTLAGLCYQRAVHWENFKEGRIAGSFAESWEWADSTTLKLKIRPNVFFHDKAPVNGRAGTAEDVKFHIERNKSGKLSDGTDDPNFYRKGYYGDVQSVTAPDAQTVVIKLAKPTPLFLNLLAQAYEGIQAPEAVKQFEKEYANFNEKLIIGSGPFVLTEFSSEGKLRVKRNEKFWRKANLAGVQYVPLFTDQPAQQAAFEQKQVDTFAPSTMQVLNDLKERFKGKIVDTPNYSANPIIAGSFYMGAAPWNNSNLVGAIFRAYDRRQLIQQFHGGRGAMSGSIPPSQAAFAIQEKELVTLPGYLADRDKEIKEAQAMWAAGGGPALGDVTLDIPDIFEGVYGAAAIITSMLNKNLNTSQFKAKVEPYSTITTKIAQRKYGSGNANIWYGWDTEVLDPEPTGFLVANYKSDLPMAKDTFGITIPELDAILAKVDVETDQKKRADMTREAERIMLKNWGAGRSYSHVQVTNTLSWNYLHPAESAPFSTAHLQVNTWLDADDPTYQGRPSDA